MSNNRYILRAGRCMITLCKHDDFEPFYVYTTVTYRPVFSTNARTSLIILNSDAGLCPWGIVRHASCGWFVVFITRYIYTSYMSTSSCCDICVLERRDQGRRADRNVFTVVLNENNRMFEGEEGVGGLKPKYDNTTKRKEAKYHV